MGFAGQLRGIMQKEDQFIYFSDMCLFSASNPLVPPAFDNRALIGWGRTKGLEKTFNNMKVKEDSIDLWNKRILKGTNSSSYIREVNIILEKLQAMIKRKSFLERKIHRFIHEHSNILLPPHNKCLFEHVLYRREEKRKADFILEREQGLPPLLIELENPTHKILTKSLDLTAQSNHARQQISEWVSFIENDPARNASGDNYFLTGPKERLVIIGRGLEHKEKLIDTKFDGVVFWTYNILIEEAKKRLNEQYARQCELVGLNATKPF